MNEILLVEDNSEYSKAAKNFFNLQNVELVIAKDYEAAMQALETQEFNGAIIDCFFPARTGSNEILLGEEAIQFMRDNNFSKDQHSLLNLMDEFAEKVDEFTGITINNDLKHYLMMLVFSQTKEFRIYTSRDMWNDYGGIFLAMERSNNDVLVKKILAPLINDEFISVISKEFYKLQTELECHYEKIQEKMEIDENEQPLGVLVALQLIERKIPFVLATSTYHHGVGTQAIHLHVLNNDWPMLIDCLSGETKESLSFWQRAFEIIK